MTSTGLRHALRAELTAAMKRRDRTAIAACRSALGAIDNAESEGIAAPRAGAVEASALGVGAAEAARRELTEHDVRALLAAEAAAPPIRVGSRDGTAAVAPTAAMLPSWLPTQPTTGDRTRTAGLSLDPPS